MNIKYENKIAIILYAMCDDRIKIAMFMNDQFRWTLASSQKEKNELPASAIPRIVNEVFGVKCTPCIQLTQVVVRGQGNIIKNTDYFIAKCDYQMLIPTEKMEDLIFDIGWFDPEEAKALKMDAGHAPAFYEALQTISNLRRQLKNVA